MPWKPAASSSRSSSSSWKAPEMQPLHSSGSLFRCCGHRLVAHDVGDARCGRRRRSTRKISPIKRALVLLAHEVEHAVRDDHVDRGVGARAAPRGAGAPLGLERGRASSLLRTGCSREPRVQRVEVEREVLDAPAPELDVRVADVRRDARRRARARARASRRSRRRRSRGPPCPTTCAAMKQIFPPPRPRSSTMSPARTCREGSPQP